ncbi:MAG: hypothetical protein V3V06_06685 [Dehalococcoidia bacterium]
MPGGNDRPRLSFDLDGVLARPLLGWNPTIDRDLQLQPLADAAPPRAGSSPTPLDRALIQSYYRLRYIGRPPRPAARAAVEAAARRFSVLVLSARNWRGRAATEGWLHRHGILSLLDAVVLNDTGLPAAQFKRQTVERLGIVRHVDDDAATAALLARGGVVVDLIDWPRNRGLTVPPGVTRRADLRALIAALDSAIDVPDLSSTRGAEPSDRAGNDTIGR